MKNDDKGKKKDVCRILVIGSHKVRVAKVMTILTDFDDDDDDDDNKLVIEDGGDHNIPIEYIPCVAKFDSYQDENGNNIRYLLSVDYYGPDCTNNSPSSLLQFFDDETSEDNNDENDTGTLFIGITGAAIGCGIEGEDDTIKIETFLKTMVLAAGNQNNDNVKMPTITPKVQCIQPNPDFQTMHDEMIHFKNLSIEDKDDAIQKKLFGPWKMAKFIKNFTLQIIQETLQQRQQQQNKKNESSSVNPTTPSLIDNVNNVSNMSGQQEEEEQQQHSHQEEEERQRRMNIINNDPNQTRYLCRKCRSILFYINELQDPPHVPSKHQFSYRKQQHNNNGGSSNTAAGSSISDNTICQSYFLNDSNIQWIGNNSSINNTDQGKFNCPYCNIKLGTWHWSGTQCSCGTWVVPAIQIPKSKVDEYIPNKQHIITNTANTTTVIPTTLISPPGS